MSLSLSGTGRSPLRLQRPRDGNGPTDVEEQAAPVPAGGSTAGEAEAKDATGRETPATDAPGGQEVIEATSLQPAAPAEDDFVYADVLCYDGCQEKMWVDPQLYNQILLSFITNWLHQPTPSPARKAADAAGHLPEEEIGLHVPRQPRPSHLSLYKLEQRLALSRRLDQAALAAQIRAAAGEHVPTGVLVEQPGVQASGPWMQHNIWLDEHGLLKQDVPAVKGDPERPYRRFDQNDEDMSTRWAGAVTQALAAGDAERTYRLDVAAGRCEFLLHQCMSREHQLAAALLRLFQEHQRRAAVGLAAYYATKLAALEDLLLDSREQLFEGVEAGAPAAALEELVTATAALEREVAEVRQLREEEDQLLLATLNAMGRVWAELLAARAASGRALTNIQFSVVQLPDLDDVPLQQDGLSRRQLDMALLVAEQEPVAGLPAWPSTFPLAVSDADFSSTFGLRRVECMAGSYKLRVMELTSRLKLLQERVSADPEDPEITSLQQQLEELGPGPRRPGFTLTEEQAMRSRAQQQLEAGELGVFRPPRLQPRVTVTIDDDTGDAGDASGATDFLSATGQTQTGSTLTKTLLSGNKASSSGTVSSSTLKATGAAAAAAGSGGGAAGAARFAGHLRYYCRLLVNGHVVGTTEAVSLKEDFTLEFRDVFSIRVYQWPKSVQLQLWQKGTVTDTQLAEMYVVVPGLHGTPHVDPQAKPYSWTCPAAVPAHRLARAAALAQAGIAPGATLLATTGRSDRESRTALHPSGVVHVRCGWVTDPGVQGHFSPFSTAGGVTGVTKAALESGQLASGGAGADGLVQLTINPRTGRAMTAAAGGGMDGTVLPGFSSSSPGRPGPGTSYGDTLRLKDATAGGTRDSPGKGVTGVGKVTLYGNPLAAGDVGDVEAGAARLMPRPPEATSVRALHQAANSVKHAHSPAGALAVAAGVPGYSWLTSALLDPNDPRNAPLLELLKARDAAGEGGGAPGLSDLFRLDTLQELAMAVDRGCDQRAAFLKQRWDIGPRAGGSGGGSSGGGLRGADQRLMAPLARVDDYGLPSVDMQGLAAAEAASWGVMGHTHLAEGTGVKWASGELARALEERAQGLRSFSLRIRAALQRALGTGRQRSGLAYKTTGCVKETPLPDFRFDLSGLTALLQPVRPLRPPRLVVKKLHTLPPAEQMRLVVVVQRASHLPKRLSQMGGVQQKATGRLVATNYGRNTASAKLSANGQVTRTTADNFDPLATGGGPGRGGGGGGLNGHSLSCFVEASYRGYVDRTSSVDSDMPIWNQQLLFPLLDPDQPASSDDLQSSNEVLTLSVFDEVLTATSARRLARSQRPGGSGAEDPILAATEALGEGGALPEKERRYLGSVRVPVAAIYQADLLQGAFKLDVPPVIIGYDQDSGRPPSLHVYITLRPRLAPPVTSSEELVAGESDEVVRHARKWVKHVLALPQCRCRVVRAIAVDAEGVGSLLTRYLHPTPLPPALEGLAALEGTPAGDQLDRAMLTCARWVASVPYMEDAALNRRRSDVWTSSADFLALSAGDGEEHAHLLGGYFLALGQQAYIVLGTALTGASAAFVLTTGQPTPTRQQQQAAAAGDNAPLQLPQGPGEQPLQLGTMSALRLWNPLSGHCCPVKDPAGELREVGTVYSATNIWVNIQEGGRPWDMSWQLADPLGWRPFFGEVLPHRELASLQAPPVYRDLRSRVYEELEACAEEAVRNALYEARSMVITASSNTLSRSLKQLLKQLPAAMSDIQAASLAASVALSDALGLLADSDALQRAELLVNKRLALIQNLQMSHQERVARDNRDRLVNGHILAVPFSNNFAEAVKEAVLSTGIHRTKDPRVKFAMAAYVESLGHAFVCRCWLYVAAIRET